MRHQLPSTTTTTTSSSSSLSPRWCSRSHNLPISRCRQVRALHCCRGLLQSRQCCPAPWRLAACRLGPCRGCRILRAVPLWRQHPPLAPSAMVGSRKGCSELHPQPSILWQPGTPSSRRRRRSCRCSSCRRSWDICPEPRAAAAPARQTQCLVGHPADHSSCTLPRPLLSACRYGSSPPWVGRLRAPCRGCRLLPAPHGDLKLNVCPSGQCGRVCIPSRQRPLHHPPAAWITIKFASPSTAAPACMMFWNHAGRAKPRLSCHFLFHILVQSLVISTYFHGRAPPTQFLSDILSSS